MRNAQRVLSCLIFSATAACDFLPSSSSDNSSDRSPSSSTGTTLDPDINPCDPDNDPDDPSDDDIKPEIWDALENVDCDVAGVQAAADVTVGATGLLRAQLLPIDTPFEVEGMCPVNVHWHLGAEHRNEGTFDIPGDDWIAEYDPDAPPDDTQAGNFCPDYDPLDAKFTTPYEFEYCSEDMRVGYTYEMHWPHSNLGMCGDEWQYQTHFMNGVLCKANEAYLSPTEAVESVFDTQTTKIGVQAQVFTIVNDPAYDYPDWLPLEGWNTDLTDDIAVYQGSTTGSEANNQVCRGTGGMVTWRVDRDCHLISARAFDELCRVMKEQRVDMTVDTEPHGARETTDPANTTDVPMVSVTP